MSHLKWASHCPSANQSMEAGDMGTREKMSHLSLSHRPLLGPNGQDSKKAEPSCPWSVPLPHPCSCHSCRSTGLQGAGSGSQTPPPRSSGGPRQCHGADCETIKASSEETPYPSPTSSRAAQGLGQPSCISLTPPHNKIDGEGRVRRDQNHREREQGDRGRPRDTHRRIHYHPR